MRVAVRFALFLVVAFFVACGGIVGPTPGGGTTGFDGCATPSDTVALVTPVVSCVLDEGAARHVVFGYRNAGAPVTIPSGPTNRISPDPDPRLTSGSTRPTSSFMAGDHLAAFEMTYVPFIVGELTWQLAEKTASTAGAPSCGSSTRLGDRYLEVLDDGATVGEILLSVDSGDHLGGTIVGTSTPLAGKAAGETSGALSVGSDGSANYSIPLWVSPGRAGVQPDLALSYDSGGGNGLLGVGWSLRGFSQISRCAAPAYEEGSLSKKQVAARPVKFEDDDQLCLDGDLLLPSADGSSLFPQRDPFTRVRVEKVNGAITGFTVEMKSGRILHYGNADARIEGRRTHVDEDGNETAGVESPVTLAWLLSEVRDRSGNRMAYGYEDFSNDRSSVCGRQQLDIEPWRPCYAFEKRPKQITYTHGPGTTATKRVVFQYDSSRPDAELTWIGGFPLKRESRITRIEAHGPKPTSEGLLRAYNLSYSASSLNGRSLLSAVSECDGEGVCKPATTFDYEKGATTFSASDIGTIGGSGAPDATGALVVADFTGDGRDDLLYTRQSGPNSSLSLYWFRAHSTTGSGYEPEIHVLDEKTHPQFTGSGPPPTPFPVDFDGDGRFELVFTERFADPVTHALKSVNRALRFSGGDFVADPVVDEVVRKGDSGLDLEKLGQAIVSDLHGDGRAAFVKTFVASEKVIWDLGNLDLSDLQFCESTNDSLGQIPFALPFDGATRDRLLIPQTGRYHVCDFVTRTLVRTPIPTTTGRPVDDSPRIGFADVNGDGTADALVRAPRPTSPSATDDMVAWNTGTGMKAYRFPLAEQPSADEAFRPLGTVNGTPLSFDFFHDGHPVWLLAGKAVFHEGFASENPMLRAPPGAKPVWQRLSGVPASSSGRLERITDANGDGLDDLILSVDGVLKVYVRDGKRADMLTRIHRGLGDEAQISYKPIRPDSVAAADCGYPIQCTSRGTWTVDQVTEHANNPGAKRRFSYLFSGGAIDLRSRSFLGFKFRQELDLDTNALTRSEFGRRAEQFKDPEGRISFPFARAVTHTEQGLSPSGGLDSKTITTVTEVIYEAPKTSPDAPRSSQAFVHQSTQLTSESPASGPKITLANATQTLTYDPYGNPLVTITKYPDLGIVDTTTATWEAPDTTRWLLSRVKRIEESSEVAGYPKGTRARSFVTDDTTGLLSQMTVEPDNADLKLVTSIVRQSAGLPRRVTQSDGKGTTRTTDIEYDALDAIFPTTSVDSLGYVTRFVYHSGLGVLAESTDPNGVRLLNLYDGFGRLFRALPPRCSGLVTGTGCSGASITHQQIPSSVAGAVLAEQVTQIGSPTETTHYDSLGRIVRKDVEGFGLPRQEVISYDPIHIGAPQTVGVAAGLGSILPPILSYRNTSYVYDSLGRATKVTASNGGITTIRYDGLRTTVRDSVNSSSYVDRDQLGRTIRSSQLLGLPSPRGPAVDQMVTSYEYGPFSLLQKSIDPQGNVTSYVYDAVGQIVSHSDFDSGTTSFVNDAFGEVTSMRDAEGRETLYGYDPAGRRVASKAPDGLSCFEYDAGAHAIGRRTRARRIDTDGATSDTVETWTDFDPLGRPSVRHQTVNGGPDLSLALAYDTLGRPSTLTYPEVAGQTLRATNTYTTTTGYLQSVSADSGAGSLTKPIWEETSENPAGELTGESFGGGVIKVAHTRATDSGWVTSSLAKVGAKVVQSLAYDYYKDGNIKRRDDASERTATGDPVLRTDRYSYDKAKRLTSWSGTWGRVDYDYDESDNLLHRTISGPFAKTETFTPGLQGPRAEGAPPSPPHGVMAFDAKPYSYNRAGDQTSAPGRTVEWTTFHLPRRITQGDLSETRFVYGPDHERVQKIDARGTTTYVGDGLYERREHADGASSEHVMSIEAGGRPVAQTIWRVASSAVVGRQTTFLLQDHLGSPHVITDEAGTPVDHIVHEPFGRRVNPADPTTVFAGAGFDDVHAGFTGHEEDRELGLVNMRGRIYDPTSARFTSADPVVGAGMHNRYAYVRNNPINAADPSGFCDYLLWWCGGGSSSWFPTFGGYQQGGAVWETPPTPPPTEGGPSNHSPPPPPTKQVQAPAPPRPFTSASGGAAVIRPFGASMFTFQTADGYCIVGNCGQRLFSGASTSSSEMQVMGVAPVTPYTQATGTSPGAFAANAVSWLIGGTQARWAREWLIEHGLAKSVDFDALAAVPFAHAAEIGLGAGVLEAILADARTAGAVEAAPSLSGDVDQLAINAERVATNSEGYFNVVTHGDQNTAWAMKDGQWVKVSHRLVAKFVRSSPEYSGGPVRLISCEAGACSTGFAQNLANKLGVRVLAPTQKVFVGADGLVTGGGEWRPFIPGAPFHL